MNHNFTVLITIGWLLSFSIFPAAAMSTPEPEHTGDRAYLGIYSNDVSEEKAELLGFPNEHGSYISRVIPNSAADQAGLQPFDYVFGIDEARTSKNDDLTDLLGKYDPGDAVSVHYIRDGRAKSVQVILGKRSDWSWSRTSGKAFLGISPDDNDEDEAGVPVSIVHNSTAEELGLQDGDIITAINGHPMIDWEDITTAINNTLPGNIIEVSYERNGRSRQVSGTIQSRAADRARAEQYSRPQERAFLGIRSSPISKEKAELLGFDNPYGSYVTKVLRGTAAEAAGIQPFDYIYGIDEFRTGERQSLSQILRKYAPGDDADVHLLRKSRQQTIALTLGRASDVIQETSSRCEEPFFGIRHSHEYSPDRGVAVTVVDRSTAEKMGLQDGDVLTAINGYPIIEWQDVSIAIDNMEVGQTIEVDYRRNGRQESGRQPIQSRCDTEETSSWSREPDWDFDWEEERERSPRQDISNMDVEMRDMPADEAQTMEDEYDIDLSTDNDLRIQGLNLFPNPSTGMFNLAFNLPREARTLIRIYNAAGRQIYNYDLGVFSGEFTDEINIAQNGPGSYFLQIRQGNQSVAKKIIVSRR